MAGPLIEELRIRGLGVIDDALLELGPGLTVVTGETGAGKTMVVTALGLLLGGRADAGAVRTGSGRALVEGRVAVAETDAAAARAAEAGAELDDGALILARTVSAEGRSRAHLGGRSVPVGVLADLGADLVAVHGQSDQQRLLLPARQRDALDRYAGEAVGAPLGRYRVAYARVREVQAELTAITTQARERAQEADLLRFGLAEIAEVAPQDGEDVALSLESARLGHADALSGAAVSAHENLLGDGADGGAPADAVGLVALGRRALEPVREHDPELAGLADRLAEVSYLLADVAADLSSYADAVDADPLRLAAVEDRRAALATLTRKYGPTASDVIAWAAVATAPAGRARGRRHPARVSWLLRSRPSPPSSPRWPAELTCARTEAAEAFGAAVTAELAALAMPDATVSVGLTTV